MKVLLILMVFLSGALGNCVGKFVNPVTDLCWKCMFPITIAGVQVVKGKNGDSGSTKKPICRCTAKEVKIPYIGIPVGFWEPVRMVDITRTPYCLVSLGGKCIGKKTVYQRGDVDVDADTGIHKSFYHVHWYVYPVLFWMEIFLDFICLDKAQMDIAYLTELDPLWNRDQKAAILTPEAALFGNVLAQSACIADCIGTTARREAINQFFWCNGCQGSLYPFTGTVDHHVGGVQASLLIAGRFIAKLHRELLGWGTIGENALCGKYLAPIVVKSQYRFQMTYPVPNTQDCWPFGHTEVLWQGGREYPYQGSDFAYMVWRKRECCLPLMYMPG